MSRDEFLRAWDRLPQIKTAELIDKTVYVASPVSIDHGRLDNLANWWLTTYAMATPGCEAATNTTWLMLESAPQPDACLYRTPVATAHRGLASGAPELVVEVTLTSTSHDFGPKLALYQRAGVKEYLTLESVTRRAVWRVLNAGSYRPLTLSGGLLKSRAFPGLWLDADALWQPDTQRLRDALNAGLSSSEHSRFAARIRK